MHVCMHVCIMGAGILYRGTSMGQQGQMAERIFWLWCVWQQSCQKIQKMQELPEDPGSQDLVSHLGENLPWLRVM